MIISRNGQSLIEFKGILIKKKALKKLEEALLKENSLAKERDVERWELGNVDPENPPSLPNIVPKPICSFNMANEWLPIDLAFFLVLSF